LGAPRIHGELLKLGFEVAQSTVARYMCATRGHRSGWRTFLSNHVDGIAAIDLFVLPTISFQILYCLVIVRSTDDDFWVSFGVTATNRGVDLAASHQAFPWTSAAISHSGSDTRMVRVFLQRIRAMGIRTIRSHPDRPARCLR